MTNTYPAEQMHLPIPNMEDLIQETTHQVPCGRGSIFDPDVEDRPTEFERAVYLVLNEKGDWEEGISHALSFKELSKLLNVKSRSQVTRAVKGLIRKGWLEVAGQRKLDGVNFYKLIHHKGDPPLDQDNRAFKCAVPSGEGAPTTLMAKGVIGWRVMVQWIVAKIDSDWVDGVVEMTINRGRELLRFAASTISQNFKKMADVGLAKRISEKFRASEFQLFPKPYPRRRKRKDLPTPKGMKLYKGWYYSFNKLWRFRRDDFHVQMCEHGGKWRDSSMNELERINLKIHRDFGECMNYIAQVKNSSPLFSS